MFRSCGLLLALSLIASMLSCTLSPRSRTFSPMAQQMPAGPNFAPVPTRSMPPNRTFANPSLPGMDPIPESSLPNWAFPRSDQSRRSGSETVTLGKPDAFPDATSNLPESGGVEIPARSRTPRTGEEPLFKIPTLPDTQTAASLTFLRLELSAPQQVAVGETIPLLVTITNDASQPIEDAVLHGEFEDALIFPGSSEKGVRKKLRALKPGESLPSQLGLQCETPGRWNVRFRVEAGSKSSAWKSVSIIVTHPGMELAIHGPQHRIVGQKAEFNFQVLNRASLPAEDVQAEITFDGSLQIKALTANGQIRDNRIHWSLGTLQPNEGLQLQVEFECREMTSEACVRFTIKTAAREEQTQEVCLTVAERKGSLNAQLSDLEDPIPVGSKAKFLLKIRNEGLEPVSQIAVTLEFPDGLKLDALSTLLNGSEVNLAIRQQGNRVLISPLETLKPESIYTVRILAETLTPGPGNLQATVNCEEEASLQTSEWITVLKR